MSAVENPPKTPVSPETMRMIHHDYLVDLERRGILFGAGPFVNEKGERVGVGMLTLGGRDGGSDFAAASAGGVFSGAAAEAAAAGAQTTLNAFMALGPAAWSALRGIVTPFLDRRSLRDEEVAEAIRDAERTPG